jgi:dienelactone hydrolase
MRQHAHEFAEAGFIGLVPDLFWRQEPGVELSDHNPEHVKYPGADHAFARHGGKTYSKPEADRALALTVEFFKKHLGGD